MNWKLRQDREKAYQQRLAIKHRDGHIGFIERPFFYSAYVKFPNWDGKERSYKYGDTSESVEILDVKFNDYKQAKEIDMNALYEMTKEDGSKSFAVKVAEKSKTLWVMEIKGTGEFMAVETSRLQEVLPYTVSVKFQDGRVAHYEVEEGKVVQGDILVLASGNIVTVCEVNTKVKGVNELKTKAKLVTIPI